MQVLGLWMMCVSLLFLGLNEYYKLVYCEALQGSAQSLLCLLKIAKSLIAASAACKH